MAENRVTLLGAEILETGGANARVTELAAEVLETGGAKARITELAVEVLYPNSNPVNGTAPGDLIIVTTDMTYGDVEAPGATVTATVSAHAGEAGEAVAVDGTRIFEFAATISDATTYSNADFDSIYSIGDRTDNGLARAGVYGHPGPFFGLPPALYNGNFSFPTGDGFTYNGGSPLPVWGHWITFGLEGHLMYGVDIRAIRMRGNDQIDSDDFFTFQGGIDVGAIQPDSYALEFDYFNPGQSTTLDSLGQNVTTYEFTPRYPIPWPHYEYVFPGGNAVTQTFANEVEFRVAHSSLDGGDRRPGHAAAAKTVVATLSSDWTEVVGSGHPGFQDACFDGDNYFGNDGSGHNWTSSIIGTGGSGTGDQTTVGAYIQFVFPRKVCMRKMVFQVSIGNKEVWSGADPTKYGKWHWEISTNGGTTYFKVGDTWWFREGGYYMLAPQFNDFGLPRNDSSGVPLAGATHWRMVLDAEGPLCKFGSSTGIFQIMFDLEDQGDQSLALNIAFTDDTDNALPTLTVVAGNPYRVQLTDGDSDALTGALTVIPNLNLTAAFSDGDSDGLDAYGSFFPSTVVQTIINSRG